MNNVTLIGRLTKDPEVTYTDSGKIVARFTLAVNRPFKNNEGKYDADFFNVVVWGKQAEILGNGVSKGQRLAVEGQIRNRHYTAKDGTDKQVTEIIVNSFDFLEYKESSKPKGEGMEEFGTAVPANEEFIPF